MVSVEGKRACNFQSLQKAKRQNSRICILVFFETQAFQDGIGRSFLFHSRHLEHGTQGHSVAFEPGRQDNVLKDRQ